MNIIQKNKLLILTLAILIATYFILIFVAPDIPIWSLDAAYHPDDSYYVKLQNGQIYEHSFTMPYDYVNKISINIKDDEDNENSIIPFDARMELLDSSGNDVIGKTITSVYDKESQTGYIPVNKYEEYTFRLTINDVDSPKEVQFPQIEVSSDSSCTFNIAGRYNGAPSKISFTIIYLVCSAVILLYVYTIRSGSRSLKKLSEILLLGTISVISILMISQIYDLEMTAKGALKIIESFKTGHILDYYDYSYSSSLDYGADIESVTYNYDFFLMLPIVIVMLPFSLFITSDISSYQSVLYIIIVILSIMIFAFHLICSRLIKELCTRYNLTDNYSDIIKSYYLFSPLVLYISIAFGQIDLIYILVILLALLLYFKEKYAAFTLVMSLAISMKSIPLMIFIPLILLVKKKPVQIFSYLIGILPFPAVSFLLFKRSFGYIAIMNIIQSKYSFLDQLFTYKIGDYNALFIIIYAIICIYAYSIKSVELPISDRIRKVMLFIFLSYSNFAAFTNWHTQWLIPLFIALAFLIPMSNNKLILPLGVVLELLLILSSFGGNSPTPSMTNLFLPAITGYTYHGPTFTRVFNEISPQLFVGIRSLSTAVLIALSYLFISGKNTDGKSQISLSTVRYTSCLRITILYASVIMFLWCYYYIG